MVSSKSVAATALLLSGASAFAPAAGHARTAAAIGMSTQEPSTSRRSAFQTLGLLGIAPLIASVSPANAESADVKVGGKMRFGDESIMDQKAHGSSAVPVQENLRYGVSRKLADKISNYNRRFAEFGGYFQETQFEDVVRKANGPVAFYDSNTGKPLFQAPVNRSVDEFIEESKVHGWPSFRDEEVVWDNVRVLKNSGETVSVDGTHLGHNLPDKKGNRYCINLVSVAGSPA